MKTNVSQIEMLQYQIKRYHAMRNGAKCQLLTSKLQKLMDASVQPK
jgi:hypothetical protein